MQRPITRGASANSGLIFHVFAQDSTSTTGAGKASIAFGSWTCYYIRSGEAISGAITPQDITTIGTYAAPTANTNIRIKAVDNTNMIGVYEVQIHLDWVNTTNSCQSLTIYLSASGVAVLPIQIPLEAVNRQSATAFITGVNSLAPPTNWNLTSIDASGRVDVIKVAGTTQTARDIGASVLLSSGTGTGQLDFTSGVVKSNLAQILGTALTETVGQIAAGFKQFFNISSPTSTMNVITTTTTASNLTTNNDKTGYALSTAGVQAIWDALTSALTAVGSIGKLLVDRIDAAISSRSSHSAADVWAVGTRALTDKAGFTLHADYDPAKTAATQTSVNDLPTNAELAAAIAPLALEATAQAILLDTAEIGTAGAGLTNINLPNQTMDIVGSITGNLSGSVGSVTNPVTVGTNSDKTGYALTSAYDPAKTAAQAGDAMTLTSGERNSVADAYLDRVDGIETGFTPRESDRIQLSAAAGKLSGAATSAVAIRDVNDTTDRIAATVDADGNRTAVTLDAS